MPKAWVELIRRLLPALMAAMLAVGTGCAFQGHYAERRPLAAYLGDAVEPEVHRVPNGWALKASLHNHTAWSHGALSAEELVRVARSNGIAVLAVTEHDILEACYTRAVCFRDPSVVEMGYEDYFRWMGVVKRNNPDMIILPALEVTPYAYWRGFPPFLRLHGWNRHFTVYDFEDSARCAAMPTLGNQRPRRHYLHGDQGIDPYARFTRYVAENGGMVFLAHPERQDSIRFSTARTVDDPYPELVAELPGMTGFAALPDGRDELLEPGGIWDQLLMEYLRGERADPVWALGDADFHGDDQAIDGVVTWFYVGAATESDVLEAMRNGRMTTLQGRETEGAWVTEFSLGAPGGEGTGVMLGEVSRDPAAVEFRFGMNREVPGLELRLIRNGEVIFTGEGREFRVDDSEFRRGGGAAYYRVEGEGDDGAFLATNPVFHRGSSQSRGGARNGARPPGAAP